MQVWELCEVKFAFLSWHWVCLSFAEDHFVLNFIWILICIWRWPNKFRYLMKTLLPGHWEFLRGFYHREWLLDLGNFRSVIKSWPRWRVAQIGLLESLGRNDSLAVLVRPKATIFELISLVHFSRDWAQVLSLIGRSWRRFVLLGHLERPLFARWHSEATLFRLIKWAVIVILGRQVRKLFPIAFLDPREALVFLDGESRLTIRDILLPRVVQCHSGRVCSLQIYLILWPIRLLGLRCQSVARRSSFIWVCLLEVSLQEAGHVIVARSRQVHIHWHVLGWVRALTSVEGASNRHWEVLLLASRMMVHGTHWGLSWASSWCLEYISIDPSLSGTPCHAIFGLSCLAHRRIVVMVSLVHA